MIGPFFNENIYMGPVITKDHKIKIEKYISQGINEGADLVLDGRNFKIQGYENGNFIGPTLFDNVKRYVYL